MTREMIIDKIIKLKALAENNTNEEQAYQATVKVKEWLAKYRIEETELQEKSPDSPSKERILTNNRRYSIRLAALLADQFGCAVLYQKISSPNNKKCFYYCQGNSLNTTAFSLMYSFLLKCIQKESNRIYMNTYNHYDRKTFQELNLGKNIVNSYAEGFLSGLQTYFNSQEQHLVVQKPEWLAAELKTTDKKELEQAHSVAADIFYAGKKDALNTMNEYFHRKKLEA